MQTYMQPLSIVPSLLVQRDQLNTYKWEKPRRAGIARSLDVGAVRAFIYTHKLLVATRHRIPRLLIARPVQP